jgi:hypothetical protein
VSITALGIFEVVGGKKLKKAWKKQKNHVLVMLVHT